MHDPHLDGFSPCVRWWAGSEQVRQPYCSGHRSHLPPRSKSRTPRSPAATRNPGLRGSLFKPGARRPEPTGWTAPRHGCQKVPRLPSDESAKLCDRRPRRKPLAFDVWKSRACAARVESPVSPSRASLRQGVCATVLGEWTGTWQRMRICATRRIKGTGSEER